MKEIEIYTDGSCLGNPGAGGYAAILSYKGTTKELSCGYRLTTNNRMELLAAIVALESLKEACKVQLYTDSQYLKNGVESWLINWQKNGWKNSAKKPVKNIDLWQRLLPQLKRHKISFTWLKAHNGHTENERCDFLAKEAASSNNLLEDINYQA